MMTVLNMNMLQILQTYRLSLLLLLLADQVYFPLMIFLVLFYQPENQLELLNHLATFKIITLNFLLTLHHIPLINYSLINAFLQPTGLIFLKYPLFFNQKPLMKLFREFFGKAN